MVYPKETLRSLPVSQKSAGQWHALLWRSIALVFALAWGLGLPRAILVGPTDPLVVVFAALGAGIIPAAAGWFTLWRRQGDLRAALWATGWASLVLFLLAVWAGR